jgi:uncharacterized protein YndB with AHSA1/START domain
MTDQPQPAGEPVEVDEHIEAPPAEVFEYVTDPDRRPFGGDDFVELGEELLREEPSRIAWRTTTADGEHRHAGTVEIAITPDGAGSRVRVTHRIGSPVAALRNAPELALAA